MSGQFRNPLAMIGGLPFYHLISGIFFVVVGAAFFYYFHARRGPLYSGLFMVLLWAYGLFRIFLFLKSLKKKKADQ